METEGAFHMGRNYKPLEVDSRAWELWEQFHDANPQGGFQQAMKWAKANIADEELQKDFLLVVSRREGQAAQLVEDVKRIWPESKGY
jgi:hypothetical protein